MNRRVFTLPDLGEGLEEAQLVRWLVAVGDVVTVDAPVAEVETAKAMVEVPCPYAGVIACLHGDEGDVIGVGSPLVSVDPAAGGPSVTDASPDGGTADRAAAAHLEEERAGSGNILVGYGTSSTPELGAGRRAVRRAALTSTTAPARPTNEPLRVAVSSPLVRSLAKESGVDLATLQGTGPGGVVTRADVERAAQQSTGAQRSTESSEGSPGPQDTDPRTGLPVRQRIPVQGVRRAIATTLSRSRHEIPEATTWVDVDATRLLELRSGLTTADRKGPGLLALLARFVVAGLERFPELNSWVDVEHDQIVHLDGVDLGIATQTDRGLVVPVVRDAHRRTIRGLGDEIRRLTSVAREGRATAGDLTGGSFTLNSYGTLGVDGSAAIINHPEVAILGIGRIIPRPWVVDGVVAVRDVAQLSLVFDHRVCDGGTAGGFLRYVADAVEQPVAALVDMAEL